MVVAAGQQQPAQPQNFDAVTSRQGAWIQGGDGVHALYKVPQRWYQCRPPVECQGQFGFLDWGNHRKEGTGDQPLGAARPAAQFLWYALVNLRYWWGMQQRMKGRINTPLRFSRQEVFAIWTAPVLETYAHRRDCRILDDLGPMVYATVKEKRAEMRALDANPFVGDVAFPNILNAN